MPLKRHPRSAVTATVLSLLAAPLALTAAPASANPAGTGLVISEVYGAGGNAGAAFNADFVELYNPTDAAISLSGLSVQYRSASGSPGGSPYALTGSVPAGKNFLIRMSATGATGAALPEPDAVALPAFNMAAAGGQVLLINGTTFTGTGNVAGNAALVDMVGATGANTFEAAPTSAGANAANSLNRAAGGADTDNNAADFSLAAPSPTASGGGTDPGPDPVRATIAEIQGDGAVSPLNGDPAITRGVVTATYPTGGFNGFYIQTEGTGGATDATPGRSDALFVFGSAATAAMSGGVAQGDLVEVRGGVTEFAGTTEIVAAAGGITELTDAHTDPVALATTLPATEAEREAHEGELLAPSGPFVASDVYNVAQYAAIGLAAGDKPLVTPTEVEDAQTGDTAGVAADNAARAITLDDGASINFLANANKNTPVPWLRLDRSIRTGAAVTFTAPVILEYRNDGWNFQPTQQVTGDGSAVATFEDTRTPAPEDVGGDLRIATFNVLNYFNTTGEAYVAGGGSCSFYTDREGNRITVNDCGPTGPRGAADDANLKRQQDKIVAAINQLGASVVSLEEVENSVALGEADRDDALRALVNALNEANGSPVWEFVPSPAADQLPPVGDQDVIRTAFIYKSAAVSPVGASKVLVGSAAFSDAREPLAQVFAPVGAPDSEQFALVVNHFKSKGSGTPDPNGQGNANDRRILQAQALASFADAFAAERSVEKVFLAGDFNAYSKEDPIQVLEDGGYALVDSSTDPDEETYTFDGMVGSLDHVLANEAAATMVTGADIWNINADEPVAYEYSRYNNNITNLYAPGVFRSSDHDPEIVGLKVAAGPSPEVKLNLLGVNDFHGRINANTVKWAGTVEQLTEAGGEANTLFVGAGDLIGASEFASAVADDQPTIDVLNALGLDASAVGNHEFDKGWADLRDRVIGPDDDRNAQWDYLGANVYNKGTTEPAMPEYAMYEVDGLDIAVVGAVTEETSTLVSPGGITEIDFGNPVDAVNRVAGELSDGNAENGEADVIVATFHAGASVGTGSNYEAEVAKGGEFAEMANLIPAVDVIFNGHTHQAYAWDAPVPGEPGKTRPIVQTGKYADNVGQVELTVDRASGEVTAYTKQNVARTTTADADLVARYPRVAEVKQIVDAALAEAAVIGNQPVGSITGDITRARNATGAEDRGAESTLGDLVGNALRDGIPADIGEPDLGIVNPGGLRADLLFAGNTANNPANTNGVVTYAEANAVLPFVNNIWLVDLTGAELKQVLEQQWQPTGASRPYLQLGLSDNVRVTADPTKPAGERITSVYLNDEPLDPEATYTVSTFSFLGTGGDNFGAFTQGDSRDTGLVDRDLWISYLEDNQNLAPDFARQQVEESGMPAELTPGQAATFTLRKLDLTSAGSPANTTVEITADDGTVLGSVPVSGGSANITVTAPAGAAYVVLTAKPSGTKVTVPVAEVIETSVSADPVTYAYGTDTDVVVSVTPAGASGEVRLLNGATVLDSGTLAEGTATLSIPGKALLPGEHTLTVRYLGGGVHLPSESTVKVTVTKATPAFEISTDPAVVVAKKTKPTLIVKVASPAGAATGTVQITVAGKTTTARLVNGVARIALNTFKQDTPVLVSYSGDSVTESGRTTYVIDVVTK